MPTEVQEAIGAAAYRMANHVPHIVYGTDFDRFAWTVPPNPIHADCSGACSHVFWDAARIRIGGDTGAIARDVEAGNASWVSRNAVQSCDLVMRRSGTTYNGGADEHVGIFMYRLSDGRPVTFESAGSKDGVGYYPRPTDFWRDGVRYPQLHSSPLPREDDDLTEEEHNWLHGIAMLVAKHDDMLGWLFSMEVEGGYPNRGKSTPRVQQVLADTQSIKKKLGA